MATGQLSEAHISSSSRIHGERVGNLTPPSPSFLFLLPLSLLPPHSLPPLLLVFWNRASLCTLCWPQTLRSSCLSLPRAGITGGHHHVLLGSSISRDVKLLITWETGPNTSSMSKRVMGIHQRNRTPGWLRCLLTLEVSLRKVTRYKLMEDGSFQKQLSTGFGLGCLFTPASVTWRSPSFMMSQIFGWSLPLL